MINVVRIIAILVVSKVILEAVSMTGNSSCLWALFIIPFILDNIKDDNKSDELVEEDEEVFAE